MYPVSVPQTRFVSTELGNSERNAVPYLGITCMHAVLCKYIYICIYICVRTLSLKNIRIFIFDITLNENYV